MANKQDTTPRASLQAILQQDEDWAREMIRRTVRWLRFRGHFGVR